MHNIMPKAYRSMVVTPHYLASNVGSAIIEQGGNAVDAAIAVSAMLAVVYPHMTGLGGDSFFLIYSAKTGKVSGLNGSGRSALRANASFYLEQGLTRIPDRGVLSAITVPGMVDSWWEAWSAYGRLSWEKLLAPALEYAAEGFPISRDLHRWMKRDKELLLTNPALSKLYCDKKKLKSEGTRLIQPELARTFQNIIDGGRDSFYSGVVMNEITSAIQRDGGLLSEEDFRSHRSSWVEPLSVSYRGNDIYQMPPNSQGFALLMMLNLLEPIDLGSVSRNSAEFYHLMTEVIKMAFHYRDLHLSDPEFTTVPLEKLLDKAFAAQIGENICYPPNQPSTFRSVPMGQDTAYAAVVDDEGNAVSFIQSLYYDFGSGYVAGDTGIVLQNRGSFFSLQEGHPNLLEPCKRTFHTLMPGMALRNGKPCLLMGTQGGEGQPQTQLSIITGVMDYRCTIQEAIGLPRWVFGRTWGEDSDKLRIESRVLKREARRLKQWGHDVQTMDSWDGIMGQAQGIKIDDNGSISGAADPRGDGLAIGR